MPLPGCYDRAPAGLRAFSCRAMANIKQQKKRIRIAADERLENLRYRSTIKTLTEAAVKRRRGRRRRSRGDRAPQPCALDRPGRLPRGAAPQRRRPQEVAGRPARRTEGLTPAPPRCEPRDRRGSERRAHSITTGSRSATLRAAVISTNARSSSRSPASREPPLSAWSSSASRTVTARSSSGE